MQSEPPLTGSIGEIDFRDLVFVYWKQKLLIAFSGFIFFCFSIVYVCFSVSHYDAKAFIVPPAQSDIANFNYGRTNDTELKRYSVKDVYDVFLRNLHGEFLRREFFEDRYLPSLSSSERDRPVDLLYGEFSRVLTVSGPVGDRYVLTVRNRDPALSKAWAEEYLSRAGAAAKAEMIKNVSEEAEVRARNLAQKINTLRDSGQKVREDLIVQLREALQIAHAIDLETPPLISSLLSSEVSAEMSGELTYMRGSKALEAAIGTLEARKSDDPFIKGLRELQVAYSFYKNLEVKPEVVEVYRLDGPIELPDEPVGPKKIVIITLSLFLGVLVGFLIVTCRVFLFRRV